MSLEVEMTIESRIPRRMLLEMQMAMIGRKRAKEAQKMQLMLTIVKIMTTMVEMCLIKMAITIKNVNSVAPM